MFNCTPKMRGKLLLLQFGVNSPGGGMLYSLQFDVNSPGGGKLCSLQFDVNSPGGGLNMDRKLQLEGIVTDLSRCDPSGIILVRGVSKGVL